MKVHRNLVWVRAQPELLDRLLADPTLARFVTIRLTPELAAIRPAAQPRFVERLKKLGISPRETGGLR